MTFACAPSAICRVCSKPMVRRPTEGRAAWKARKSCSIECRAELKRQQSRDIPMTERHCLFCQTKLVRRAKEQPVLFSRRSHCDRACWHKARGQALLAMANGEHVANRTCGGCGQPLRRRKRNAEGSGAESVKVFAQRRFCSQACYAKQLGKTLMPRSPLPPVP